MSHTTVLLDIGGVLTPDPWETLLFHPSKGVLRDSEMSVVDAICQVGDVWNEHAVSPISAEEKFWSSMSAALGTSIDTAEVDRIKYDVLAPRIDNMPVFDYLRQNGGKTGIISNNTAFFYPIQSALLSLELYIDPDLVFLSHQKKLTKGTGLFELAAQSLDAETTVVVDDRHGNLTRAQDCGFSVVHYDSAHAESVVTALQRHGV